MSDRKMTTIRALLGLMAFQQTAFACDSDNCITRTVTSVMTFETIVDAVTTTTTTPEPTSSAPIVSAEPPPATTSSPPQVCVPGPSVVCPSADSCPGWTDWTTYKPKNGVNLGGWLELEQAFYPSWWHSVAPTAEDEWTMCEALGDQCGPTLEQHYASYITTSDIDKAASAGVEILRIPLTYAAFVDIPGSQLYHGNQLQYLRDITEYAISTYDMRIILDLHSLPGGVNGLDAGEAADHTDWFYNSTNLDYSYQVVDAALDWIRDSSKAAAFTFEPVNEASDNFAGYGTAQTLTAAGTAWVVQYSRGVIDRVKKKLPCLPVMVQDSFMGEAYWSSYFGDCDNVVLDVHLYDQTSTAETCATARSAVGDGKLPVFVGEWDLEMGDDVSLEARQQLFSAERYAWSRYLHGGAFWSIKFNIPTLLPGDEPQHEYMNYEALLDEGVITPFNGSASYC